MVSEEQLEFSENGSDKKGPFKVFWRGRIKQYSCEMGFEKYNILDWVGVGVQGRAGKGRQDGCERAEQPLAGQTPFSWTLELESHSALPPHTAIPLQAWDSSPIKPIPEAGKLEQEGVRDLDWSSRPLPFEVIRSLSAVPG